MQRRVFSLAECSLVRPNRLQHSGLLRNYGLRGGRQAVDRATTVLILASLGRLAVVNVGRISHPKCSMARTQTRG